MRFLAGIIAFAILAFACSSQHPLLVGSSASTIVSSADFSVAPIPAAELARKTDNESDRHAAEIPVSAEETSEDDLDEDADQNELLALVGTAVTRTYVVCVDVIWDRSVQRLRLEEAPSDLTRPPNA